MEPQQTPNNGKKLGIGIAVVALIALVAVIFGAKKSSDTPATTPTVTDTASSTDSSTSSSTAQVSTVATTPPTSTTTAAYKDGMYSATGSYMSPGGEDHLAVTLTLKNDIVTNASVTAEPGDNTSRYYQNMFIANCRPLVIGKNISTLRLSKVSGSSLTSGGFNDAVAQIKAQAKA